jgi:lipopolysaccharide/colanic/teichoic acid biosynthesis glycosyltransferase
MNYSFTIKTILDQIFGWLLFLALSPLLLTLAILIRLDSPGPVFFRQVRIGRQGRPFVPLKFRSMVDKADVLGLRLSVAGGEQFITRIGKIIRATSLDELPQLWNVIKGDMSLVGPRPTLPYQVAAYNDFQRRRLEVKPGITGWAQINGRNAIPWEERIRLDVWYVDNWSLRLDFYILLKTFKVWARQEGLYGPMGVNYDFTPAVRNPESVLGASSG